MLGLHPPFDFVFSDMEGYVGRAMHVASGGEPARWLVLQPPGTHLLLALPMKLLGTERAGVWGGAVLWWTFSSLTPLLAWRLSRHLLGVVAAAISAVLSALYPLNITFGGFFSAETPSITLLLATLLLAFHLHRAEGRRRVELSLYLGIGMGSVLVVRPQLLFNLLLIGIPLLAGFRRHPAALGTLLVGGLLVVGPVFTLNARAAGEFVGISDYDGFNFFFGHCDARLVRAGPTYAPGSPVNLQLDRGIEYSFPDHPPGDKSFYFGKAFDCIGEDGLGHLAHMARNVRELTYTTIPHPHEFDPARGFIRLVNTAYSILLPVIVAGTLLAIRRDRRQGKQNHRGLLLLHLVCMIPLATLFFGDPRYRFVFDVFGLMLLAALIADRITRNRTDVSGGGSEVAPT